MSSVVRTGAQLIRLRKLMASEVPPLKAYIIPSCDAHHSEYLASCDERRAFITGFNGSAGTAIVTAKDALLWTDARYYLQAEAQMDENWTLMKEGQLDTPSRGQWLAAHLDSGANVGVDPFLMTVTEWKSLKRSLDGDNIKLVAVKNNLVDAVWGLNQPERPNQPIKPLELKFTGKSWEDKVHAIRGVMKEKKADVLVLSALDDSAWFLNLRGSDITYNPVFFCYTVITQDKVYFFANDEQVTKEVVNHLKPEKDVTNIVEIKPYESITGFLSSYRGKTIWLSNQSSQALLLSTLGEKSDDKSVNKVIIECSPVTIAKANKNSVEINGFINCHVRDAAALCNYFAWLEKEVPKGTVTEISGSDKLESFRAEMENFVGLSFDTISSVGPNAAIIHYKATPETSRALTTEEIYLVDSGGQYKDGTTDVTRTMHFGTPKPFEKECFTRVLKGQIKVAQAVFPTKIKGNYLDTLARLALWEVGLDYGHGTGHGVGAYLNVHEGPMGISWRPMPDDPGLQVGMVLSNEPGYYQDGEFGIRIENLVHIVKADTRHNFRDRGYLTFEDLTVCPIQQKLIDPTLLTQEEISYINQYHQKCRDMVGPLLREMGHQAGLNWLIKETRPIG